MVRCKWLILSMLSLMLVAQSCIHGDMEECPPMVNYAVAFEYTNHTGEGDRFYDDVKKINLYVFDATTNELVYTITTEISPNETNFTIPLDQLPMGNYHIIAWGNVLDDQPFTVTPDAFVEGETTLDEARLILQREADNLSREELEKLFYGELPDVQIPLYINRTDTIPLTNDTKRVRVVLYWDHTGAVVEADDIVNYDEVGVYMRASNAVYDFGNQWTETTENVLYKPYQHFYTGDILKTDPWTDELPVNYYTRGAAKVISDTCVYDFTILRMMVDSPIQLTVERKKPAVNDPYNLATVDIIEGFSALFGSKGFPDEQRAFDKYDDYRVNFYFTYDKLMNTYVSGALNIVPWQLVEDGEVPMN